MGRYKKSTEKFEQYTTTIMTLMRRAGGFSWDEQLELIYANMNPAYKRYIRKEVKSLSDLQMRATEEVQQEEIDMLKREKPNAAQVVVTTYNKKECC